MNNGRSQGLAGRERHVHQRNRADRDYHQLLIDDYLEPDPDEVFHERRIPIGGCSEFLPDVHATLIAEATRTDTELGMPSARYSSAVDSIEQRAVATDADRHETTETRSEVGDPTVSALKVRRHGDKRRHSPSARGFLVGCALGGGVAAMLLALLWVLM